MRHSSEPSRRPKRLAEQIRQVVTAFLQGEARDPRIGLVTITGVELTADLQHAVVRFVVHGSDEQRALTQEGLTAAAAAIRRRLADTRQVRLVPEVAFEPDKGVEHAARIEQLLADLHKPKGAG